MLDLNMFNKSIEHIHGLIEEDRLIRKGLFKPKAKKEEEFVEIDIKPYTPFCYRKPNVFIRNEDREFTSGDKRGIATYVIFLNKNKKEDEMVFKVTWIKGT
jgi:hypothetical protein